MAYRYAVRFCWNRRCRERIENRAVYGLCPSCRYLAKRAFALGSFVAGVIAWWLK